ncbi:hypothetical protein ACUXZZ_44520 [Streptomyces graminifolii]|uniref:hypothetical protein n=1 Tax=Streptomyces graminifolii TaxID=1266771 RepID=UPI0040599869
MTFSTVEASPIGPASKMIGEDRASWGGSIWDRCSDETADGRVRASGMMTFMPMETDEVSEGDAAACAPVADETTGEVRLLSEQCSTCIFRPGNPFRAAMPARIRNMVADAVAAEGHVTCHATLPGSSPAVGEPAICRGFADAYGGRSLALRARDALGLIREVPPPS